MNPRRRRSALVIACGLLVACSPILNHLSVSHEIPAGTSIGGPIFLRPPGGAVNPVFQRYAAIAYDALAPHGLTRSPESRACFVGILSFAIKGGPQKTTLPLPEKVGGGFCRQTGVIDSANGSAYSYRPTPFSPPIFSTHGVYTTVGIYRKSVALQILDRRSGAVVWEGRNYSEGRLDTLDSAVPRLIRALLRDFPGRPGRTRVFPSL